METPQPQKSKVNTDSNHDYISNLPADIKEKILLKLPIKEVVRTSILSSKWNELWTSIPDLVFEEPCTTESNLIKLVDMVLLAHKGPIQKFKLVSKHACNEAIDRWMFILSRNGIGELKLIFDEKNRCKIPYRLFSCLALGDVNLSGCVINVSRFSQGFKLVKSLALSHFDLSGTSIEKLIFNCPLLECLGLSDFQEGCLRIIAPNLTHLYISGEFHDICLETPKLISAFIDLVTSNGDYQNLSVANIRRESNITHAFGRLSNIQKLEIFGEFTEYLSMGPIPENTPTIFENLTELLVCICISNPDEIATSLCLFQNAPNLETLHIEFSESDAMDGPQVEDLWGSKAKQYCLFKHLKIVNIMYSQNIDLSLRCTKSMLEFAKVVIHNAPVLDKLNAVDLEDVRLFFEMLNCCPKLSEKSEVVFVNGYDEE